MQTEQITEAPELFCYTALENTCPFCESSMLAIVVEDTSSYYKCGICGNDWTVLGEGL